MGERIQGRCQRQPYLQNCGQRLDIWRSCAGHEGRPENRPARRPGPLAGPPPGRLPRRPDGHARRGRARAVLHQRRIRPLETGDAQAARSDCRHDAKEARAQGPDDDHRPLRGRIQGAGGSHRGGADQISRRMSDYGADLQFSFYQPTRVVFGISALRELGFEAKRLGIERAVVVTDRILREKTDVVAQVEQALGARCAGVYDGVIPDSAVHVIDQGAAFARSRQADGLVSVGGGSSIDTDKGIASVLTEGGSIRDHQGSQALTRRQTTHLAIPTTAGTGSEVSQYAVVKDLERHEKMHYVDDRIVPDAAILDPELTVGMPR